MRVEHLFDSAFNLPPSSLLNRPWSIVSIESQNILRSRLIPPLVIRLMLKLTCCYKLKPLSSAAFWCRSSSTTCPSKRWNVRSAYSAYRGSCVAMQTVAPPASRATKVPMPRTWRSICPRLTWPVRTVERATPGAVGLRHERPKVTATMAATSTQSAARIFAATARGALDVHSCGLTKPRDNKTCTKQKVVKKPRFDRKLLQMSEECLPPVFIIENARSQNRKLLAAFS